MTDKILFDGKDFQILNPHGTNYKTYAQRMKNTYLFTRFKTVFGAGLTAGAGFLAYHIGDNNHFYTSVCVLTALGSPILSLVNYLDIDTNHSNWTSAEDRYNLALADNQDLIMAAKEKMAQHQTNMKNIQYEKEVTFTTPMERAFTK